MHAFNFNIWEVGSAESRVEGHLLLHTEIETSRGYIKPYLKMQTKIDKNNNIGISKFKGV